MDVGDGATEGCPILVSWMLLLMCLHRGETHG